MSVSFSREVAVDIECRRTDCEGWCGHVVYVHGDHRQSLPIIEKCAALDAFIDRGDHEHCPLTQSEAKP